MIARQKGKQQCYAKGRAGKIVRVAEEPESGGLSASWQAKDEHEKTTRNGKMII